MSRPARTFALLTAISCFAACGDDVGASGGGGGAGGESSGGGAQGSGGSTTTGTTGAASTSTTTTGGTTCEPEGGGTLEEARAALDRFCAEVIRIGEIAGCSDGFFDCDAFADFALDGIEGCEAEATAAHDCLADALAGFDGSTATCEADQLDLGQDVDAVCDPVFASLTSCRSCLEE